MKEESTKTREKSCKRQRKTEEKSSEIKGKFRNIRGKKSRKSQEQIEGKGALKKRSLEQIHVFLNFSSLGKIALGTYFRKLSFTYKQCTLLDLSDKIINWIS